MTALHIAASEGHSEIVNKLLQFDANPNIVDKVFLLHLLSDFIIIAKSYNII